MWYRYVRGSWQPTDPPTRGELFGDGAFETIHVWKGHPLFLNYHLRRLREAAQALRLTLPLSMDALQKEVAKQSAGYERARLKIVLFRSGEGSYTPSTEEAILRTGIFELPLGSYPLSLPQRVVFYPVRFAVETPWSRYKTLSALGYVQAAAYARAHNCEDAIVLSAEGFIAETSRANLFFSDGKAIYTPSLRTGCIQGILRGQILQLASQLGIPVEEGNYSPQDLLEAREAFTTNVIQGITPILGICHTGKTFRTGEEAVATLLAKALAKGLVRAGE